MGRMDAVKSWESRAGWAVEDFGEGGKERRGDDYKKSLRGK